MGILRYILAVAVVLAHSEMPFRVSVGGNMAVQIFFMISGFYMALVLTSRYADKSYFLFITNRFFRIFPVYWFILVATLVGSLILGVFFNKWSKLLPFFEYSELLSFEAYLYIFVSNLIIFGQDLALFLGIGNDGGLFFTSDFTKQDPSVYKFMLVPQAWTLSLELIFYLIAPFIVNRSISLLVLLILASVCLRILLYVLFDLYADPWSHRFFLSELSLFLLGALSYRLRGYLSIYSRYTKYILTVAYLLGVVFYGILFTSLSTMWIWYLLTFMLLPTIFDVTAKSKIDRWVGELSYPIYIAHMIVVGVVKILAESKGISLAVAGGINILASTLLAVVIVRMLVVPIDAFRNRRVEQA